MPVSAVSVGTSATEIAAANPKRIALFIDNQGAQTVYIGDGSGVTTANGITLAASDKLILDFEGGQGWQFFYRGDVYGIVSSTTADVRVLELEDTRE